MVRFLWSNLRGYRAVVTVAIALTFLAVGADLLATFPFKWMLDKLFHHQDPNFPLVGGLLDWFDRLGNDDGLQGTEVHHQLGVVAFSMVALLFIGAAGAVVAWAQLFMASYVGTQLSARLRNNLFGHLERLPIEWHGRQRTGDLVQRLTGNVADIEKLVTDGLVDLLAGVLTLGGILVVMLLLNWQFTLLTMCIVPPMFGVVLLYTQAIKKASKKTAKSGGQVAEVATEDLGAIMELKAFGLEERAAQHFGTTVARQRRFGFRVGRMQSEFSPMVAAMVAFSNALLMGVGAWIASGRSHSFSIFGLTIPRGSLTIGTLTVFLLYSKLLYQPMRNLSKLASLASNAASGAERITEVLAQPIENSEPRVPDAAPERITGAIAYRDVVFGYDPRRPVLSGIDLDIASGKRVALVGLSGSGKTTLVKLVPRFYDVWNGSITVDGVDVRDIPLGQLRASISLVLQDCVLFEGSIRENIALGRPDATDEEIIEAARKASIHDTIAGLPDGYDSHVREQGKNFSGGQRQRLAIARALLHDAPILILDEPTANLDVEAEGEVMRALDTLVAGRTVLTISHRLSTLGNVDEIIVLSEGRIVERGTYMELKRLGGVFAHLLEEQSRYSAERATGPAVIAPTPPAVVTPRVPVVVTTPREAAGPEPITPAASWQRLLRGEVPAQAVPAPAAYAGAVSTWTRSAVDPDGDAQPSLATWQLRRSSEEAAQEASLEAAELAPWQRLLRGHARRGRSHEDDDAA